MGALLALGLVLSLLCIIRLEYNYKSLLVLRAHLGTEPGRWKPVYMDFVKIWLATVAVFIAVRALAMGALLARAGGRLVAHAGGPGQDAGHGPVAGPGDFCGHRGRYLFAVAGLGTGPRLP